MPISLTCRAPLGAARRLAALLATLSLLGTVLDSRPLDAQAAATPARKAAPMSASASPVVPTWMRGVWMREWIQSDTTRRSPSHVRWLQTPHAFGDLRIAKARPSFAGVRGFADASDEQLRILARQSGFAGYTTLDGMTSTWTHEVDFQPRSGSSDIGAIERIGETGLFERGLDGSWMEYWLAITKGDARYVQVRVERNDRLHQLLLVAGDHFFYVRNRAVDPPAGKPFSALITEQQPSRETLIAWLDCELSVGRIRGGTQPWEIERSTLPWREGQALDFVQRIGYEQPLTLRERAEPGERWTIAHEGLKPADAALLFGTGPAMGPLRKP